MRVMPDTPDEGIEDAIVRYRLALPERARKLDIWLVWRFESAARAGDKPLKVPYSARTGQRRSGVQGSPEDLAQLVSFDDALAALRSGHWTGLGIAHVPGCGLNSWDFDSAIDATGSMAPELEQLLRDSGTYVEVSPSGRGVRMIALGNLPSIKRIHPSGYNIECFGESGFVTVTGRVLFGYDIVPLPAAVENTLREWLQADVSEQPHTRLDQLAQTRAADPVYQAIKTAGHIKRDWPDGRSSIVCPFEAEHTSGSGRSDTVYFLPNTNGYAQGHFHCLHAHCATRSDAEFSRTLGVIEPDFSALLQIAPADDTALLLDIAGLERAVGAMRWIVKHTIPANAIGVMFGDSGTFKSFIALDMALHIAHGLPWLGRKSRPGGVVYVAGEGGAGLLSRIKAWHQEHGLDPTKARFRVCVRPLMLDVRADLKALSDAIEATREEIGDVSLVFLDTLSQTMAGDESQNQETSAYLRGVGAAIRARFDPCAVVVIHHTGHAAKDRPRGAYVIKGNTDFILRVEREEGEMSAIVTCLKQKDDDRGGALPFVLTKHQIGQDEDGDPITSLVATYHDNAATILATAKGPRTPPRHEMILLECINEEGTLYANVRDEFYTKCGDAKSDTKKHAFGYAFKKLIESGRIVQKGNFVFKVVME